MQVVSDYESSSFFQDLFETLEKNMRGDVDKLVKRLSCVLSQNLRHLLQNVCESQTYGEACGEADGELNRRFCKLCSQFGNLQKQVFNHRRYSKDIATLMATV
jgi:hypothetical protein